MANAKINDFGIEMADAMDKAILDVIDIERRRISRDLHDYISQDLAGLALKARYFAEGLKTEDPKASDQFDMFCTQLQNSLKNLRNVIFDLVPLELAEKGLLTALQELSASVTDMSEATCYFVSPERIEAGDSDVEFQLLSIAREAIHNALKHSRATRISLVVEQMPDVFQLSICDNGIGIKNECEPEVTAQGLRIMNYRANMIGARLDVKSLASGGVLVSCTLAKKLSEKIKNN